MTPPGKAPHAWAGPAALLALAGLFLILARISWLKWGDVLNDTGYDLTAAWKVSEGQVLYRDLAYNYGPIPPHLNALVLRLFGLKLWCFVALGFLSLVLAAFLLYRISRLFLNRLESAAVVAVFLLECGFGHYTSNNVFNWVLPYTFAATYGMVAALASFLFLARHLETLSRRDLALAGALAGIAALCKVEIGGAIAGTIAFACVLRSLTRGEKLPGDALAAVGPFLAVLAVGLLPFVLAASAGQVFLRNMLKPGLLNVGSNPFLLRMAGALDPGASIDQLLRSAAAWAVVLALVFLGGTVYGRARAAPPSRRRTRQMAGVLLGGLGAWQAVRTLHPGNEFRLLPALCVLALAGPLASAWRARRAPGVFEVRCAALAVFALLSLSRTLLQVWPLLYGFYAIVPGLILFAVFLLRLLPRWLERAGSHAGTVRAVLVIVLLGISVRSFAAWSLPNYRLHIVEVRGPAGRMRVVPSTQNVGVSEALDFLRERRGEMRNLVFIPGGVVNFLTLLPSPIYQSLFNPIELNAPGVEAEVIRDLERKAVEWILIADFPMTEFGYKGFGEDYGVRLMRTIEKKYQFQAAFGPSGYGCVLYRRN